MIRTYGAILFSVLTLPLAAVAQDGTPAGGCHTQGVNVCLAGGAARLSAVNGEVLLSRGAGFAQIGAGEGLSAGDRLLVKKGNATLALGPSCRTTLGVNSMVTITQAEGVTCASPVSADPSTAGADLPSRREPPPPVPILPAAAAEPFPIAPVLIGAGIAGIAACAAFCEDNNKRGVFIPAVANPPPPSVVTPGGPD